MGQREVLPGEIVKLAWEAEDRVRAGASCLAHRKLARRGELSLARGKLGRATVWTVVARRWRSFMGGWLRSGEDVYEYLDGDAAWRAAIGWDGKGEPEGFARHRRRA